MNSKLPLFFTYFSDFYKILPNFGRIKDSKNGFWDFPTFTLDSELTDDPCGNPSQKKVDLKNDVILNQISNKRDVSAKWISGKNPLKILFCFKNCCDSCLVLLWVQNYFGTSKLFWSSTNHFRQVQFVLVGSRSFWTQIIKISHKNLTLDLTKINLDPTKTIWTSQKQFEKIWENLNVCKFSTFSFQFANFLI